MPVALCLSRCSENWRDVRQSVKGKALSWKRAVSSSSGGVPYKLLLGFQLGEGNATSTYSHHQGRVSSGFSWTNCIKVTWSGTANDDSSFLMQTPLTSISREVSLGDS